MKEIAVFTLTILFLMALNTFCVQPIKAEYQSDITINADGSISPSTAPIQQDGNIYTLTGNVTGSRITVMRNNMTLDGDGYTVQGESTTTIITFPSGDTYPFPSSYGGIYLENVQDVTVKDFSIRGCFVGVSLSNSSHVTVSDNNITGIWGAYCFSPKLPAGIFLWKSDNNVITRNRLGGNTFGLSLQQYSEHNIIVGNTISGNANKGVSLTASSNNTFYHNNFDNELNVYNSGKVDSLNVWDNGNEGNYWSDYTGPDANGDGIGGTAYLIGVGNQDSHPLMKPWEPDIAPPQISVSLPENTTYNSSNVTLTFSTSEPASKISYSLDGQDNVTISGNTTITGLTNGWHNVTVFAEDSFGNMGTSETASFHVEVPEPFPTTIVIVSVITVAVIGVGLLTYFQKRNH